MEPQLENGKLPYMRDVYPRVSYSFLRFRRTKKGVKALNESTMPDAFHDEKEISILIFGEWAHLR